MAIMPVTPEETAATLRRRSAEARRAAEERATVIRARVRAVVRPLLGDEGRAWLIGSLAWGGFGERSDVDLVLAGVPGSRSTHIELAVIKATGVEVDVLLLGDLPASFRERVEREGLKLHDE